MSKSDRTHGGQLLATLLILSGCASSPPAPPLPLPSAAPPTPSSPSVPQSQAALAPASAPSERATDGTPAEAASAEQGAPSSAAGGVGPATAHETGAQRPPNESIDQALAGDEPGAASIPPAGARTSDEETAALDERLSASLAEFEELLKRQRSALEKERAAAAGAGGAGRSAGPAGGLAGAGSAEDSVDGPTRTATGGSDVAVEPVVGAQTGAQALGDESDESAARNIPPDIPDGADDDIVARQLREAAMKEKDPALRERLWQEYRDYTSGSRSQQKDGSGG